MHRIQLRNIVGADWFSPKGLYHMRGIVDAE